jgi:hypothetical protein
MRKFAVVTTFHEQGLRKYGQRMIDSYMKTWPKEIPLYLYPEDCNPKISEYHNRICLHDLHTTVPDLVNFKNKWRKVPKANGDISGERQATRIDSRKEFKWDAVRFSHKVYSIFHAAKNTDADILLWMDADMICHSPITVETIEKLIPLEADICYLDRKPKWPECGLYSINLRSEQGRKFLKEFQRMYDDAENGIFKMDEWHDSFVFYEVIKSMNLNLVNWSKGLIKGEGHPLINSEWGAYLDHLKGDRKDQGKSKKTDLVKLRTEQYWRTI